VVNGSILSIKVLFGDYADYYIGLVFVHYHLYKTDKDIGRYIKMHIDDGLQLIHNELEQKQGMSGTDFIINEIERGLAVL